MSDNTTAEQSVSAGAQPAKQEAEKLQRAKTQETQPETKTNQISQKIDSGERILQTTFKKLTALLTMLQTPDTQTVSASSTQTAREEQIQSMSSEQLARQLHDIEKQAEAVISFYHNLLALAKTVSGDLEKISPRAEKDFLALNEQAEKIRETLQTTREIKREKLPLLEKQVQTLHHQYLAKKIEEAGFASEKALDDQRYNLIMEVGGLRYEIKELKNKWLGANKWFQQKQIQEKAYLLKQKQNQLQTLSSLQNLLKKPLMSTSIEAMFYQTQIVGYKAAEQITGKIKDWYDQLLRETRPPSPSENPSSKINLPDDVLDSLNTDFFNIYIRNAMTAQDTGQDQIQQVEMLFKEASKIPMDFSPDPATTAKKHEIMNKIEQLPSNLEYLLKRFILLSKKSINTEYNRMTQFVKDKHYHQVIQSYQATIKQLINLSRQFYSPQEIHYKLNDMQRYFAQPEIQRKLMEQDEFAAGFDAQRWAVFRQNQQAQRFCQDNQIGSIAEADRQLALLTVDNLEQEPSLSRSIAAGYKLLQFKQDEIVPIVLLNAYRESGHSGEKPFLYIATKSENTELFRYLNTLDEQQVNRLMQTNIPGFADIIRLIKNNPQNFNARYTKNDQLNPVYQQIQHHLLEMSLYYLKEGGPDTQRFVIDLLGTIHDVDLKESYPLLIAVLEQRTDDKSKKSVFGFWEKTKNDFYADFENLSFAKCTFALLSLRETDPRLKNIYEEKKTVSEEVKNTFYHALKKLKDATSEKGKCKDFKSFYHSDFILTFLSQQPERIDELLSLADATPQLFKLIDKDGPLHSNQEQIFNVIFPNGNAIKKAKEINLLHQKAPLLLHTDNQSIASYVLDNWNTFVTDESDLLFLNTLLDKHSTKLDDQEIKTDNKQEEYQNQIISYICLEFLYKGDIAHEFLEKIKTNNWITIQTYNRLYAARRKYIGFESYAYRPKKGNTHPVINVTFYNNHIPGRIQFYEKNYNLYKKKIGQTGKNGKIKIDDFISWYDTPKKYSTDPELELVTNYALPIGISDNGYSHYYATPYGIVSGCIAENRKDELKEEDYVSSIGPLGVQLVSGHKKMLTDFLQTKGALVKKDNEHITPENAVTIDFDGVDLPSELKEMILPFQITVSEALLNLHFEQYLHDINQNKSLYSGLIKDISDGRLRVEIDNKIVTMNHILSPSSKIILKKS